MAGACRCWSSPGSATPALLDAVAILDAESRPVEKACLLPARLGLDHLRDAARWCPRLWSNERPRVPGCLGTQIQQPVDSTASPRWALRKSLMALFGPPSNGFVVFAIV